MQVLEALSYCRSRSVEIRIEGDRLKLVGPREAIDERLLSLVRDNKAGLIELLRSGRTALAADAGPRALDASERAALQPASFNQQRLWFLQQLAAQEGRDAGAYNGGMALTLRGPLDRTALADALRQLVRRHDSLRTTFVEVDGSPHQQVRHAAEMRLHEHGCAPGEDLDRLMREAVAAPFDLARDVLLRATLYVLAPDHHVLLLATHHITSDAWSQEILLRDFCSVYNAVATGGEAVLAPLLYQYADHARWERDHLRGPVLDDKLARWEAYLHQAPRLHALPCDRPRRPGARGPVARLDRDLDAGLAALLAHTAKAEQTTLFSLMASLYSVLLHRLGDEPDVVFGMPVANRLRAQFEPVAGYFANTVVLRNRLPADGSLREVLAVTQASLGFVLAQQDLPFDMLVDHLKVERDLSYSPLYQVWFSMHENRQTALDLHGLAADLRPVERTQGRYDLKLEVQRQDGQMRLAWEYDTALFEPATVLRFALHFESLARRLCEAPDQPVSRLLPVAPPQVASATCEPRLLPQAWLHAARQRAGEPAVAGDGLVLSFAQLQQRVQRLAALLAEQGVERGQRVGLCLPGSPAALVALLAAWQRGAVVVPLDPAWPAERLAGVVAHSGLPLVLATRDSAVSPALRALELVLLDGLDDEAWLPDYAALPVDPVPLSPDDGACLLPAAGGAGGVVVTHGSLAHDAAALARRHGLRAGLSYGMAAASAPGWYGPALWLALAHEGRLHVLPRECAAEPARLPAWLAAHPVDVLATTPGHYQAAWASVAAAGSSAHAGAAGQGPRDCWLMAGGDLAMHWPPLVRPPAEEAGWRAIACFGSAETGFGTLSCELAAGAAWDPSPPALQPARSLDGQAAVCIAQGDAPALPGAWGELVVARSGAPHGSLPACRTGIRARLGLDGGLVCDGRFDERARWRGLSVNPRDTEAALLRLDGVATATVGFDPQFGSEGALVAHVAARADEAQLQQQLRQQLPLHQLPQAIVHMAALPLAEDGQPDRRALPAPACRGDAGAGTAANPVESELQSIWGELLSRQEVRPHEHFFDIGGHSLLATRMLNRIRSRLWSGLTLPAIFQHPVLADLARHIEQQRSSADPAVHALPPLRRRPPGQGAHLSCGQQQLWLVDRIEQGSSHYNMTVAYRLRGRLDRDALVGALEQLVERHDALRTRFVERDGQVLQMADPAWTLPVHVEDCRALAPPQREARVASCMAEEAAHRFDLAGGMLLRVTLLQLQDADTLLLLNLHHIACDGWSIDVLVRELRLIYQARIEGPAAALPALPVRYADHAEWQRELLSGRHLAQALDFWRAELAGAPPLHALPTDKTRPAQADHAGAQWIDHLVPAQLDGLRQLARDAGTTLFICLHSLFALFIARISHCDDVVVGTAVSGRGHADTEPLVGLFANVIPLRRHIDFGQALPAYLADAHARVTRAFEYQHVPFERLVDELNPERSLGHHPVFQIAFGLKPAASQRIELAGVEATRVERDRVQAKFDLMLSAEESADGLRLQWQYATALFEPAAVAALAAQFKVMLADVLDDPAQAVGQVALLSPADHAFLATHAAGPDAGPCDENLFDRFARIAAAEPHASALVSGDRRMTYAELAADAADLAARLAGAGVEAGDRVLVHLPRGFDLIACLLGIVRLGAAYVPVDAGYPEARIRQIALDSEARLCVSTPALLAQLQGLALPVVALDRLRSAAPAAVPLPAPDPQRLAYVMYTSGSTGAPKGVAVPQRAIIRLVRDGSFMALDRGTVMLQLAPTAFDASTLEIWGPLLNGGTLAVYPETELDLAQLSDFVDAHRVNSMWLTAALFEQWVLQLERPLPHLRFVLSGGDVVPPAAVQRLHDKLAQVRVINGYGPTENTTFTCCHLIERGRPADRPVPIGRPIAGTHVRVLDPRGRLLPVGAIGELYAGGAGVALGYWRNPALSAQRFVRDADTGQLLYCTGDLVRWQHDGALQFLGRSDSQVKIRGYRIELGEIERCLLQVEGVQEACVVLHDGPQRQLVAYCVAHPAAVEGGEALHDALRRHALATLPRFMVPAAFVVLERLPVTTNGKVDKAALPAPQARRHAGGPFVPPQGPVEETLAEVWAGLLGLEQVGACDDFFALGGNSLLATRVASAYEARAGRRIPVRQLFQHSSVRALAQWLATTPAEAVDTAAGEGAAPVAPVPRDGLIPASFAQQRLWFIDRIDGHSRQYNMPALFDLRGRLDLAALQRAFDALVQRHEALRTHFREVDGAAVQVIAAHVPATIRHVDLQGLSPAGRSLEAEARLRAQAQADFDLAQGPVFSVTLVTLDEREHRLLFNMHHIASDGWSVGVLIRDLAALYRAEAGGAPAALPALPVQYAEYASWQRRQLSPQRKEGLLRYWREQLQGLPQLHGLPTDRPRPARLTTAGQLARSSAGPALARALNELARAQGASLFMVLQAAYALLLSRLSAERDIVVGTPVAGRDRREFEPLVGCFVNTLVLRNRIAPAASFADHLRDCRQMVLDAFEHQQLPFDMLVEDLNPPRSASHLPLFQLWFVLQNMEVGQLALPGLSIAEVPRDEMSAKFDLMLTATERDGRIDFNWVSNSDLFDAPTVQGWAESFMQLLGACVADPAGDIHHLPLLGVPQREHLARLAQGDVLPPPALTVPQRFLAAAQAHPERTAVRLHERTLAYGTLAQRAGRLAGYLAEQGVGPGDRIGICCGRSLEQVVAVLGIWQAGAAFVPMDPQAPRERLSFVMQDAGVQHVMATRQAAANLDLSLADVVMLDGAAGDDGWLGQVPACADRSCGDGLAYVIYTSGTTGRPKGVMVSHASLAHLGQGLDAVLRDNGIALPLRWAWSAPLVFDAALQAIVQLANGGELHVLPEELRTSPPLLVDYLQRHAIDLLDCTPSLLDLLLQQARRSGSPLPHLLVGGEAIGAPLWQDIAQWMARSARVALNVYGPTETTVDATWARIQAGTAPAIGRPLPNVRVRVLDEHLQDVAPGAVGECCIGGAGVALGYLARPELTGERFVTLPAPQGEPVEPQGDQRYYRSGDIVRWRHDGLLAYLHRRDTQVKLRGYRVELGEIEQALLGHAGVAHAAVVVSRTTGALVAYAVPAAGPVSPDELAAHCRRLLPEYMVPAAIVTLPRLPLTPNGKLDHQALPEPAAPAAAELARPLSATESALADIWSGLLGRSDLPVEANFFALGGHSLLAIRVVSAVRERLGVEVPLALFFEQATLARLAAAIDGLARGRALPPIVPLAERRELPLSHSQHRLWLIDRLEGGSPQYNMPAAFSLEGRLDAQACRRSLALIVQRHEVLRTTYAQAGGPSHAEALQPPVQRVHAQVELPFTLLDLTHLAGEPQAQAVDRLIREDARRPFDLAADVMLRVHLLRLADQRHVLVFNMHHIASDGWSVSVLVREFVAAYQALAAGQAPALAPLPVQYGDYAHWQRSVLGPQVLQPQLAYWKRQLQGLPQVHSLPLDQPRPARQTYHGAVLARRVPAPLLDGLKRLSAAHEATLFMTLQAALAALLARWSNETDIVVGTPVAGRGDQSLEPLIGFFLNTLVLRSDLGGNPAFDAVLRSTRTQVLAAFEHQHVPFEMLVDELRPPRSLSHPPLFQIMFTLQNQEHSGFELPGLRMAALEQAQPVAKFDLLLNAVERGGQLELSWTYNTDLFHADSIGRLADGYQQLLRGVAADPSTRLMALDLLPPAEARKLLHEWNDTAQDLPYEQCLHDLFVRQVQAAPQRTAVVDEHGALTYGELFAHAAALAEQLRPLAAEPETLMAVLLPKGRGQLVATLGIMMAGAAYLPLDTAWPAARVDQVLAHGRAAALVTAGHLGAGITHGAPRVDLDTLAPLPLAPAAAALQAWSPGVAPDRLAYVIFTSGSTGRPKGVAIEHRSAVNTVLDINLRYAVTCDDAVLAVSALSFDLSVYDMFGLLAVGGRVVFPHDERQKDPGHWAEQVEAHGITLWDSVPASAELLTAQYEWRGRRGDGRLRVLMMSGDWIPPALPARIAAVFPGVAMHSLGGATEGSIWSISHPIVQDTSQRRSVPYGRPLANQSFHVLTDDLAPCPVGVVGELYIGGIGVAREYYGDPERTAASFVRHARLGKRLYKTGDIGRYLPDGNIEFVGRKDHQVKIRGFRIELGEVEAALTGHEHVADAVALVLKDPTGVQQLVAYVQLTPAARALPADPARDWAGLLRAQLAATLPGYMVPSRVLVLEAFPLSANNKVDRAQLPAPAWADADGQHSEPAGEVEELLAGIWKDVLGRERVSAERNFFDLGGSSVHLIQIAARANLRLQADLGVACYFQHPTIRSLARFIAERAAPPDEAAAAAPAATRAKGRLSQRLARREAR
jgi:amino acid adenylation domain-containing protein